MTLRGGAVAHIAGEFARSIAFWLPLSVLVAWQASTSAMAQHLHESLRDLITVFAVRYFSIALLTPPLFHIVARWPVTSETALRRGAAYLLGFVPFSLAFAFIRWCLLPPWMDDTQSYGPRTFHSYVELSYQTFADLLLLYLGTTAAALAYSYFTRSRRQEVERAQLLQALAHSELQALRAQLHPHFLFNTLQGISTLIDADKAAARSMLVKLAALLRIALKHGSVDLIPLREELAFVEHYLDLEKMRLGRRLEVRWDIAPNTRDVPVPQMILQPIVENSIVHGIACSREGGWLDICSERTKDKLRIQVRNSKSGKSESRLGLGIQNTRARLKHLYADEASFEFSIQPDGVAVATLLLPAFIPSPRPDESVAIRSGALG